MVAVPMTESLFQFEAVIASAVLGISILAITLLVARARDEPWLWPLAAFFIANLVTEISPLIAPLGPEIETLSEVIYFPLMMVLGPTLWWYVKALTATEPWQWTHPGWRHLSPLLYAVLLSAVLLALPTDGRMRLFADGYPGPNSKLLVALALLSALLMLLWFAQTAVYIVLIMRRLTRYHAHLRELFASTRRRELSWIVWVLALLALSWLWLLLDTFFDNLTETPLGYVIEWCVSLLLVYILAIWGLRQRPGFEKHYVAARQSEPKSESAKYERSALQSTDATRIAQKIETAMTDHQLYRNHNLSLGDLSTHIGVTPNYVSQTLNETLSASFFDYVNRWRVQEAMPLVAAGERTVVDIANEVGFNSRSAFYKAFRSATGMTPSAYRAEQRKLEK